MQGNDNVNGSVPRAQPSPDSNKQEEIKSDSVFSYFYCELTRGYLLHHDEASYSEKRRRVLTFMKIPRELEKFMMYGFFQCLDAFLYVFTFLPIRFIAGLVKFVVKGTFSSCLWRSPRRILEPAQMCDLLKGIILLAGLYMTHYVDLSMMYHMIRGQAIIKLYIFFNMLEVGDRLFASFGQDILDALIWTATEPPRSRRRESVRVLPHLVLAVCYVFFHGILILFQATTLNVAFNSHNKALLTIMMSNNFVELKGSVFKKFEKNNLFQMSCSDVRERFHFLVLLTIVCVRNLTEFSWDMGHFWVLVPDMLMIMASEFLVDWVKHAFITKFNEIPDEVYKEYTISLAYDMVQTRQSKSHSDHLDMVSRRMGFTPLPLAVILVRIVGQSLPLHTPYHWGLLLLFYACLVSFKVAVSIVLLGKACEYTSHTKMVAEAASQLTSSSPGADPAVSSRRRLSDPNPETQGPKSCVRRSTSIAAKMNVKFSSEETHVDLIVPDNTLMSQPDKCHLFSNSTVSLQSMALNQEYLQDTQILTQAEAKAQSDDLLQDQPSGMRQLSEDTAASMVVNLQQGEFVLKEKYQQDTTECSAENLCRNIECTVDKGEDSFSSNKQHTDWSNEEGGITMRAPASSAETIPQVSPLSSDDVIKENTELKKRKPPAKSLNEIDRFTMCSSSIV